MRSKTSIRSAFAALLAATACQTTSPPTLDEVRAELLAMSASDQQLEQMVIQGDPAIQDPGFYERKDRQQDRYGERCKQLFEQFGYLGADRVGTEAAEAFWLLVQHADRDPGFQDRVVEAMRPVVARGDASPSNLAYLTDRVRANTGRPQVYGTQVYYDGKTGRILPKPLEAPSQVDERRAAVGLEPLWKYVNSMTELHFRMNREQLKAQGVEAPPLVPEGFAGW
jgi:hypothetical protein